MFHFLNIFYFEIYPLVMLFQRIKVFLYKRAEYFNHSCSESVVKFNEQTKLTKGN